MIRKKDIAVAYKPYLIVQHLVRNPENKIILEIVRVYSVPWYDETNRNRRLYYKSK